MYSILFHGVQKFVAVTRLRQTKANYSCHLYKTFTLTEWFHKHLNQGQNIPASEVNEHVLPHLLTLANTKHRGKVHPKKT